MTGSREDRMEDRRKAEKTGNRRLPAGKAAEKRNRKRKIREKKKSMRTIPAPARTGRTGLTGALSVRLLFWIPCRTVPYAGAAENGV
jgi:hypothetical protein